MSPIDGIRASDGSGNAQVATVQSSRAALASTIIVDTVAGIPDTFMGSMGTPHTFIDPVTSEEITVISEATAVDFSGHVDGANLEIDDIAPGYTDNGSEIGDIIMIRPTTQWANRVADALEIVQNLYPVGCIYMTTVATNPATVLGFGTWVAFGAGRMPIGLDSGDVKFDTVGETGGDETATLTTTELPVHTHSVDPPNTTTSGNTHNHPIGEEFGTNQDLVSPNQYAQMSKTGGSDSGYVENNSHDHTVNIAAFNSASAGSGAAFSIMNPYIVVHMFKRTA